jgi:hypothetical protein
MGKTLTEKILSVGPHGEARGGGVVIADGDFFRPGCHRPPHHKAVQGNRFQSSGQAGTDSNIPGP